MKNLSFSTKTKDSELSCFQFHTCVVSAPLPAFSASGIFCGGRYQPGYTRIFWPAEGTSHLVIISKKWKNPWEKDLSTGPSVIFDLFPWPTGFGPRSQIMEGPVLRPFSYAEK
jgi:hypothetical protein